MAVDTWVEAGSGTFDQVRQEGRLTTESSGDGLVWTLEIGLKGEGGAPPGPRHTVRVETDSAGRLRGRPPELPVLRSADGATAAVPDPYGAVPPWPLPTGPVVQGGEFTRFEVPVPTEMRVNGAWVLLEPAPGGPGAPPARIAVTGTVLGEVNFLGRPALVVGFAGETAMRFGRAVYSGYAVHDIETGAAQTSVSQLAVAGWHRGGVVPAHQAVTLRFQPE
ncbi:MAG TPA: hypothetical protein VEH84_03495 [Alphaproteobacteria bacterium]|nr:hypothetical protein [Alphaproteobacteria bacterium]